MGRKKKAGAKSPLPDGKTERAAESRKEPGPGLPKDGAGEEGKYIYCIIQCRDPRSFGTIGIGSRGDEVYTIHYEDLAAVVSTTPLVIYDPTRENILAHEQVNETVMKDFTVLPMAFGAVFKTEQDIGELLRSTVDALRDVFVKMEGKLEFGLKVNWDREQVVAEIEEENEEISILKQQIASRKTGSTYFARMQLGRLVERALSEKAEAYIQNIYAALREVAVASRANKPIGEKMIMNAAFLVERERESEFDVHIKEIAVKYEGKLSFRYTGPWPPYNFVHIRLKLERASESATVPQA